jgi:hypothetical protein
VDLYEPGSGLQNQLHDFTPGIAASGLFWTIRIPDEALQIHDHRAHLHLDRVSVEDNFTFLGPGTVPARVSLDLTWVALPGPPRHLEPGSSDPLDPTRLEAEFHDATATGSFTVEASDEHFRLIHAFGSSQGAFAEMGQERNGVFVGQHHHDADGDDDDALARALGDAAPIDQVVALAPIGLSVSPNPCSNRATLQLSLGEAAPVTLAIYDLAGRRVASLAGGSRLESGTHLVSWDLRDGAGRRVAPGVYLAAWQAGDRHGMARVLVTP